ncbi:MAG: hypothetical protein PUD22_09260 [Erysipelotrichaceae bacterium]|nr:hypothetical protein [Erysipelotrichaceae bacterium]
MNPATIICLILIIGVLINAIRISRKKKGCSCSCSSCGLCKNCSKAKAR